MSNIAESYNIGRCKVEIHYDEYAPNPREDCDCLGTIAHWHRRYDFGDNIRDQGPVEFLKNLAREHVSSNYPEGLFEKNWEKILDAHYLVLPVSLLDHSGLHIWVGSGEHWSDPGGWDSGQVGFIYCSLEKAKESQLIKSKSAGWDHKIKSKKWFPEKIDAVGKTTTPGQYGPEYMRTLREATRDCLEGEIECYDQYLTGQCYGYVVTPESGDEDSCWGSLGDIDYVKSEAYDVAVRLNAEMTEEDALAELTKKETELAATWP